VEERHGVTTKAVCWILAGALALATFSARAADPIRIGMIAPLTGPQAEGGRLGIQGAKLAVDEINQAGGVLGRQLELVFEDDQSTNPGTVLAFSKLAGHAEIQALIGPSFSTKLHAMAPDALKLGKPVMIGGTDPVLTHIGNPWFFRCRPNDNYSARVIADYGVNALGKKKWAIVHLTDTFGTSGMKLLVEALKGTGVEPVLIQGFPNNSQDLTAVVLAVKQSGADVMGSYMFDADAALLAKQLRQLGVSIAWVGSAVIASTTALKLAGSALNGAYAVVDFNRDSSDTARAFATKYEAAYKAVPDFGAAFSYDAVRVLARAMAEAKSLEPEKLREAILSTKGYDGAEGVYNFDQNGDGLHGYNIVRIDNGAPVFLKHIDFND
jgi:branched-chain amino acid transport system substrate-binding protein